MPTVSSLRNLALDKIAGAQEVLDRFESGISAVNDEISPNLFYTRKRVKSVDSILNKIRVRRRINGDEKFSIDEIGDIAGYRLVTLYDEQLPNVFESVIRTILAFSEDTSNVHPGYGDAVIEARSSPLFPGGIADKAISKIKVYRRSDESRDFYYKILADDWPEGIPKKVAKRLNPLIKGEKIREDSYSSIHILTNAISYDLGTRRLIPLEIQIRTAIEDIWSEVSHSNKYKARDLYFSSKSISSKLDTIRGEINPLKIHVNGISESIVNIRSNKKEIEEEIDSYFNNKEKSSFISSLATMAYFQLGPTHDSRSLSDGFEELNAAIVSNLEKSPNKFTDRTISNISSVIELLNKESENINRRGDKLSFRNAIYLLEIERIRMRILNQMATLKNQDLDGLLVELESLEKHDRKTDDPYEITVDPRSIINFMKYLIVSNSEDMNSHAVYLSSAYDLLHVDKTLPHNSIARIRIAREYAKSLWKEADQEAQIIKKKGLNISARIEGLKYRMLESFKIMVAVEGTHSSLSDDRELQYDIDSSSPEVELFFTRDLLLRSFFALRRYMDLDVVTRVVDFDEKRLHRLILKAALSIPPEIPLENRLFHLYEAREYILQYRSVNTKSFVEIENLVMETSQEVIRPTTRKKTPTELESMARLAISEIQRRRKRHV